MTGAGNPGREWIAPEPPEWSPFGGRVWAHSDPERGMGLMVACTGKVMEVSVEISMDGAGMHATIPLDRESTASLLEFVRDQLTANGVK